MTNFMTVEVEEEGGEEVMIFLGKDASNDMIPRPSNYDTAAAKPGNWELNERKGIIWKGLVSYVGVWKVHTCKHSLSFGT